MGSPSLTCGCVCISPSPLPPPSYLVGCAWTYVVLFSALCGGFR